MFSFYADEFPRGETLENLLFEAGLERDDIEVYHRKLIGSSRIMVELHSIKNTREIREAFKKLRRQFSFLKMKTYPER